MAIEQTKELARNQWISNHPDMVSMRTSIQDAKQATKDGPPFNDDPVKFMEAAQALSDTYENLLSAQKELLAKLTEQFESSVK